MKIHESSEDYLEAIYVLKQEKGMVRSIDIVNHMGFSKPTVSIQMKKFKESGDVTIDDHGYITLTKKGLSVAEKTFEKHSVISNMLMALGVSKETALHDACHIEHCLSEETFAAIKSHWQEYNK